MSELTESYPAGSSKDDLQASGAAVAGTGASVAAVVAGACCVVPTVSPLIVAVLGAGGAAWAAGFAPWAPWLLVAAFVLLAFGFQRAYRRGPACRGGLARIARVTLWFAGAMWVGALALNLVGRS